MERELSKHKSVSPGRKPQRRSVGTFPFSPFLRMREANWEEGDLYIKRCLIPSNLLPHPIASAFRLHPNPLDTLNLRITPHTMAATSIIFASLLAVAFTSPVAVPDPNPQLNFNPLAGGAPPLPVLQVPTPALASPPFQGSDIKPKKIGYFWTGAGDNQHAGKIFTRSLICPIAKRSHSSLDFLATYSLDDVRRRKFKLPALCLIWHT